MALALAQYDDLFKLVSGYLYWRKSGLPNRVCLHMYRLHVNVPSGRRLYICLSSESNGTNLLDEHLKRLHSDPSLLTLEVFWE